MMVDLQKLDCIKKSFKKLFEDQKYTASLPLIEEIISKLQSYLPVNDPELEDYVIDFAQNLNAAGMIALERKKYDIAYKCLKKAESLNVNHPQAQSTTYNNLGVYYKKKNKLTTSLLYLQKSLQTQLKNQANSTTLPDIYINLSASLSAFGNHHQSCMNVMMGVILQQHQIMTTLLSKVDPKNEMINPQRFNILALGYHNLAVELQHLKKNDEAKKYYQKSSDIIKQYNQNNKRLYNFLQKTKEQFKVSNPSTSSFMPPLSVSKKSQLKTEGDSAEKQTSETKLKNVRLKFQSEMEKFKTSYNHRRNSHFNLVVRKHTKGLSNDLTLSKFTKSTVREGNIQEYKSMDYRNLLDQTEVQPEKEDEGK